MLLSQTSRESPLGGYVTTMFFRIDLSLMHFYVLNNADERIYFKIENNKERAKGFEPSTTTLARLCSTTELHPHLIFLF